MKNRKILYVSSEVVPYLPESEISKMSFEIPNPIMVDEKWVDRPKNNNKLKIWENFERKLILDDFYDSLTIEN